MQDKRTTQRGVSLAEDRRARVPFSIVGVLLLVTSVTVVTVIDSRPDPEQDIDIGEMVDSAVGSSQTAIRTAVQSAAQKAAQEPLSETASTPGGQAIAAGSDEFRRYLKLRIYLSVQRELQGYKQSVSNNTYAKVSVPEVYYSQSNLTDAIGRVDLVAPGDDPDDDIEKGELQATIRGVTVTPMQGGEPIGQPRSETVTVTVGTTLFSLRNKVQQYQSRLNTGFWEANSATEGFGRKFAAMVYPWMYFKQTYERINAKHMAPTYNGKASFGNIISNYETEVFTNTANIWIQQNVFGTRAQGSTKGLAGGYVCLGAKTASKLGKKSSWSSRTDSLCTAAQAIFSGDSLRDQFLTKLKTSGVAGMVTGGLQSDLNSGGATIPNITIKIQNVSNPAYHQATDQYYDWRAGENVSGINDTNVDAVGGEPDQDMPDFRNEPAILDAVIDDIYRIDPDAGTENAAGDSPSFSISDPADPVNGTWNQSDESTTLDNTSVNVTRVDKYDDVQYQQERRYFKFEVEVTSNVTRTKTWTLDCVENATDCTDGNTTTKSQTDTVVNTIDIWVSGKHSVGDSLTDFEYPHSALSGDAMVDPLGIENPYTTGGNEASGTANSDFSEPTHNFEPALGKATRQTLDPVENLSSAESDLASHFESAGVRNASEMQSVASDAIGDTSVFSISPKREAELKSWLEWELAQTNETVVNEVDPVEVQPQEMVTGTPFERLRTKLTTAHGNHDFVYRGSSTYATVPDKTLTYLRKRYLSDTHRWIDNQSEMRQEGENRVDENIAENNGGSGSAGDFFSGLADASEMSIDFNVEPSASSSNDLQGDGDINYRIHSSPAYLTRRPMTRATVPAVRPMGEGPEDPENTMYSGLALRNYNVLPNPGFPLIPWPTYWYASLNFWQVSVAAEYPRFAVTASTGSLSSGDATTYVRQNQPVHLKVNGLKREVGSVNALNFSSNTTVVMVMPGGSIMPKGSWGAGDRFKAGPKYQLKECSSTWLYLGPGFRPGQGSKRNCQSGDGGSSGIPVYDSYADTKETLDDIEDGEIGGQNFCGEADDDDDGLFSDSLAGPGAIGLGAGQGIGARGGGIGVVADQDDACEKELRVEFLHPGTAGASILVQRTVGDDCRCSNKTMLIDTGPDYISSNHLVEKLEDRHVEDIDYLVVTHNHTDHAGGLLNTSSRPDEGLLGAHEDGDITIDRIYFNGVPNADSSGDWKDLQRSLEREIDDTSISTDRLSHGDGSGISIGDGVNVEVLNPPSTIRTSANGTSCSNVGDCNAIVLKVSKDDESFLFSSDIRKNVERELADDNRYGDVDVLQLAHHAGSDSNSEELFISDPEHAVFTGGDNNIPIPQHVKELVEDRSYYSTYQSGDIVFIIDEEGDLQAKGPVVVP